MAAPFIAPPLGSRAFSWLAARLPLGCCQASRLFLAVVFTINSYRTGHLLDGGTMDDSASADDAGRSIRAALLTLAQLAILPVVFGCAMSSKLAERQPLHKLGTPQVVAVIASREAPKTRLQVFARGEAEGALRGAASAAAPVAAVAGWAALFSLLAGPATLVVSPVLGVGVVGLVAAGTAVGAGAAVPSERAAAIEQLAADAIGELRLPERTAAAVASSATKFAELDAAVIDGASQADSGTDRALRARGFGVAIEFKLKEIGFEAVGARTMMSLFLTAEASLVDTATGKPVARRGLIYVSPPHAHELWTRDDGALTKAETERACNTLAERMVEDLLLGATAGPARPGTSSFSDICGLAPRSPALEWEDQGPAESNVQSVTPLLAWEKAPRPAWSPIYRAWDPGERPTDEETPWGRARPDDISYDLRIWSVVDGAPDALVYERLRLPQPQHRVEVSLDPGSTYFWSVRMRYVIDGRLQATRWSAAHAVEEDILHEHLKDALFYALADNGKLKRAICMACQCLDFTPASKYFRFRTP